MEASHFNSDTYQKEYSDYARIGWCNSCGVFALGAIRQTPPD